MAASKEDPRFAAIRKEKEEALGALEETYAGMLSEADRFY